MRWFNKNRPDVILLHAPSIYDFRKTSVVYGPVSDLVPSTPIFEMYPIGFASIASHLEKNGINVRIINLALRMLKNHRFDVEKYIRTLNPLLFGIDLHWLPHCHGSVEIARIVKRVHPETPIVFGGFSASYFHQELIGYPEVDFVLRGDSTEEPMRMLVLQLKNGQDFGRIPNLTWKKNGQVFENPLSYIPQNIDDFDIGYEYMVKSVWKYRDLTSILPFREWLKYPIMAAFASRGCNCNCVFCGGSNYSFRGFLKRDKTAFRSPEAVVKEVKGIAQISRGPIFILGDIRLGGKDYIDKILEGLAEPKINNQVIFEFYNPPPEDFFVRAAEIFPHHSYEMSLESHDEAVRSALGKGYSNQAIEEALKAALTHSSERFDLYFLVGLPRQTAKSVLDTVSYCRELYEKFNGDKRLRFFISPLAPFLDPGSRAFEHPEKFGYRMIWRTLEEHRQALLKPSWKYILNYETEWMTRDEIVDVTYRAALELNEVKREYGIIDEEVAERTRKRVLDAMDITKKIDEIMETEDREKRERKLALFRDEIDRSSISTVCEKRELEWPVPNLINFRVLELLKVVLS
ncbi:MAG: TIGR04190 family B12-binding domain/radical SAM domain protein [Actinomycetota bacterium]